MTSLADRLPPLTRLVAPAGRSSTGRDEADARSNPCGWAGRAAGVGASATAAGRSVDLLVLLGLSLALSATLGAVFLASAVRVAAGAVAASVSASSSCSPLNPNSAAKGLGMRAE